MELNEIRAEIDGINEELLALFEKRMQLSAKVAAFKQANGMEIFVPAREEEILRQIRQHASPELADYSTRFFQHLMQLSREYQVALLGLDSSSGQKP